MELQDQEASLFECMEGSDFNSVDWVNQFVAAQSYKTTEAIDDGDDDDDAQDTLVNAVRSAQTRLQTRSQELSRDAERLMERLLALGPRSLQELDRVERDASVLKQDLKRLQDESKISTSTGGPFQTLKSLDIIKTNLERCVNILQETGSWNVLVREMEGFFAERNLGEVASRLATMKQSADTLRVFPGNEERQDMLERMEQRLEALVRPGLAHALEQADSDRDLLKQSVIVYTKLGRSEALLNDLASARGKLLFDLCWKLNDANTTYARFTDRVFARLREVELPLCEYAFSHDIGATTNALCAITRACFDLVTAKQVLALLGGSSSAVSCDKYVAAHLACDQFVLDISNTLLKPCTTETALSTAVHAVQRPFTELDARYLDWEAAEIAKELQSKIAAQQHENGFLGPSEQDQLMLEMHPADLLDSLSEACISRCTKLRITESAWQPICKMYMKHLTTCAVFSPESKLEPRNRLKTLCQLKSKFEKCIAERCRVSAVNDSVAGVDAKLQELIAKSKLMLFDSFLLPALTVMDVGFANAKETESITRVVDHLYSLIPLLEFEYCTVDFMADPKLLGGNERRELESMLGGLPVLFSSSATARAGNDDDDDVSDIPRQVSASWLECIARALCTAFVLRVLRLKSISDAFAARLGEDADSLEKTAGSVLSPGDKWDPALGVCRVVLSAEPGLTYLKLGNPMEYLDARYYSSDDAGSNLEALKALERILVGLRTRQID